MATELFPKGAEHTCRTEIACLTGSNWLSWSVHPEEAMRRVVEAGGMTDAYGRDYSIAEFIELLREKDHVRGHWPCRGGCVHAMIAEMFGTKLREPCPNA